MKDVKNIIFDMGGVLVGLDKQRCIDAFLAIGAQEIASYVEEHRTEDLFLDIELGRITTHDFCEEVRRRARCNATDEQIIAAWSELTTVIPDEKLSMLRDLKRHYRLFLLSNTNEMHWLKHEKDFLRNNHQVSDYFEHVFLSYEMRLKKPDTAIYAEVLRQAGLKAEETLFIDDSVENCQAAAHLGIQTLHETTGRDWMKQLGGYVATIGMFDGVHRGHQYLLRQVVAEAKRRRLRSKAITFIEPPRQVITGEKVPVLTTVDEKSGPILQTGIDQVSLSLFDKQTARLTARRYMEQVLKEEEHVRCLILGYDNRFGSDRTATFDSYVAYGKELGIEVLRVGECPDVKVSSSAIRQLVAEGLVDEAASLLGHPYSILGTVVKGQQEGRKIGFPTANLDVEPDKLLPKAGVYAARVDGLLGMLNIGHRPTYNGRRQTIELNIFDFEANLYGRRLKVELLWRVRDERKFPSPDALRRQLEADREAIKSSYHDEKNS